MSAFPYDDADSASARLLAEERQGGNAPALSITEIAGMIKRTVEDRFGHVRLRGEISGYKRAASGHVYLSLKDENARIDGVMWKGNAARLAFRPEDGLEVIATGKITTYPGRSNYQIVIDSLEIAGEGALMALFEKTKMRLTAEGLFDAARKQALPHMPRTIGVVTSPTGAVIRDILHRLADRFPSHVIVWPVLVQGQGAASQVAAAIRGFDALPMDGPITRPDLLIVARGGGSIEDLWSFNEEIVVRAIADCTIPVISAVGHETDTTLADYAADMRAPTPTAAAEMAVPVLGELAAQLGELRQRSLRAAQRTLALASERLSTLAARLPDPVNLLSPQAQRVDDLGERLWRGLQLKNTRAAAELARAQGALRPQLVHQRLAMARQQLAGTGFSAAPLHRNATRAQDRLSALSRLLDQLDPAKPLAKGYAMVLDADGEAVTKAATARKQSALTLKFGDGDVLVHPGDAPPLAAKAARPRASSSENGTTTQPKLL